MSDEIYTPGVEVFSVPRVDLPPRDAVWYSDYQRLEAALRGLYDDNVDYLRQLEAATDKLIAAWKNGRRRAGWMMETPAAPCRIHEYDGAYKCFTHQKTWGAITNPGTPCAGWSAPETACNGVPRHVGDDLWKCPKCGSTAKIGANP